MFVHLHVHSEYSLVDSLIRVEDLAARAAALGMPAVAVSDQANLFAMVKFYKAALAAGVKPLIGVECLVAESGAGEAPSRLLLLCRNEAGYRNLTRLVTRAYTEGQQRGQPLVERAWVTECATGLLALSGGSEGDIGRALLAGQPERARQRLDEWRACFHDAFYLEVWRTGRPQDEALVQASAQLAQASGAPLVASNDVRFLTAEDFEAHEARVCIASGATLNDPRRARRYSSEQYLRSPQEMQALFADLPQALDNSLEIARRCSLPLKLSGNFLPAFPTPRGEPLDDYLRQQAREGLAARFASPALAHVPMARRPEYAARLELELGVIVQMGFAGYFLIVADFIRWAKANGVPVGPGRGSGAGSLVAFALGITDLDPIRYDLLFERFLNPERVSMPDFDIDFCMERRDRVIDYVAERYGRDRVSQIITYGSMAAKAVVRDVSRVLGLPYAAGDRIAKAIPFALDMTLDKALAEADLKALYAQNEEVRAVVDLARPLEGLARNAGKHAGGVVIAPTQLTDFAPLYCEPGGGGLVTQFDKDDVEAVGLVKFDFLGLRTLTIIDWALDNIAQLTGERLDINALPLDDPAVYALLRRCDTSAVFQLESRGMRELMRQLRPDSFEDVVALVALFRPGPLNSGMASDFCERKHGKQRIDYFHPWLEPILKPTYGTIVYQEQVMQIAQVLAGYSLGGADLLRRAMGKKKPEEMAKQRQVFQEGAAAKGVDPALASRLFDAMEKFAEYGFNKSHSAAYALLAYQTAWLKAHHPAAFMAAVLSSDMNDTDKVVALVEECREMGLTVLPPDINRSQHRFTVSEAGTIVYGLGAVKGVGLAALESILDSRQSNGPYRDLFDLTARMDARKVNRRVLEALIKAGCLDSLHTNRAETMANLEAALKAADQQGRDSGTGQDDLFGAAMASAPGSAAPLHWRAVPPWEEAERLAGERETLGFYLTGHPVRRYAEDLRHMVTHRLAAIAGMGAESLPRGGEKARVGGYVTAVQVRQSARGRMAFLTLDDQSARLEIRLFGEIYDKYRALAAKDRILVVDGDIQYDDYAKGLRLNARQLWDIEQARGQFAHCIALDISPEQAANGFLASLAEALKAHRPGPCPIRVQYRNATASAPLWLGDDWRVLPADTLLSRLRQLAGESNVALEYTQR